MKILVSFQEVKHRLDWSTFCKLKGINSWLVPEGMLVEDTTAEITIQEAQALGLLPEGIAE